MRCNGEADLDALSFIGFAFGLAGFFGVLAAYFYQNRAKNVIELLQDENNAKDAKITRLEADAIKSEAESRALEVRITAFEKLPDYSKISRQITSQHKEVMLTMTAIMEVLTKDK